MNNSTEKFLITSGYDFEGYKILEYLGFCSGECALGTGFLSSLGATFADIMGTNSYMYSEKLATARSTALNKLQENAVMLGANALIGVDVDYTTFSADIMGVIANGTAVIVQSNSDINSITISINNFNPSIPIRPTELLLDTTNARVQVSLTLFDTKENNINFLDADLQFETYFGDVINCNNIYFSDFTQNRRRRVSKPVFVDLPLRETPLLKNCTVTIKRYLDNNISVITSSENIYSDASGNNSSLYSNAIDEFLDKIQALTSVKEILKFAIEFNKTHDGILEPDFIEYLENKKKIEMLYGSFSAGSLRDIQKYLRNK